MRGWLGLVVFLVLVAAAAVLGAMAMPAAEAFIQSTGLDLRTGLDVALHPHGGRCLARLPGCRVGSGDRALADPVGRQRQLVTPLFRHAPD